jgi:hypothetical protein
MCAATRPHVERSSCIHGASRIGRYDERGVRNSVRAASRNRRIWGWLRNRRTLVGRGQPRRSSFWNLRILCNRRRSAGQWRNRRQRRDRRDRKRRVRAGHQRSLLLQPVQRPGCRSAVRRQHLHRGGRRWSPNGSGPGPHVSNARGRPRRRRSRADVQARRSFASPFTKHQWRYWRFDRSDRLPAHMRPLVVVLWLVNDASGAQDAVQAPGRFLSQGVAGMTMERARPRWHTACLGPYSCRTF